MNGYLAGVTNDSGLRQYMTSIYNMMFVGLVVSALTAWATAASGLMAVLLANKLLFFAVALSPLAIVLVMSFGLERIRVSTLHILYWSFVVLEGMSLSIILSRYTQGSILLAFTAAAAGFAGCSLWGYTTKRDLGPMGTFLIFGLFGLIALMVFNIFVPSPALNLFIGLAGVLLFAGLTAWDTQSLKQAYSPYLEHNERHRIVVMGALNLYLDFLNMFLFILRLVGVSNKD
jgi:FtsH-binding integral membrane protein